MQARINVDHKNTDNSLKAESISKKFSIIRNELF